MPDWKKKVQRALSDELRPGEDVVAAIFLQPNVEIAPDPHRDSDDLFGLTVTGGPGDPDTATPTCVDGGLAATLPDAATVLALTSQRLLALGHSSLTGRPKDIVSTLAPNELIWIEAVEGPGSPLVVMKFSDGTRRMYEAARVNKQFDEFAKRINHR